MLSIALPPINGGPFFLKYLSLPALSLAALMNLPNSQFFYYVSHGTLPARGTKAAAACLRLGLGLRSLSSLSE
jgi:hypothetical protein